MLSVLISILQSVRGTVRARATLHLEILALRRQLTFFNDHAAGGST
jgi:hypothetical protein